MFYQLQQILRASASRFPDKEAVVFRNSRITYGELENRSNRMARLLAGAGVRKGDRVALYMNRSIHSVVSLFGVLKAGGAYVPVDPMCPAQRLEYILKTCRVTAVVTTQDKLAGLDAAFPETAPFGTVVVMEGEGAGGETGKYRLIWGEKALRTTPADPLSPDLVDNDLAYILFTSGSTGVPKGVMISHRNALTFIESAHDFLGIRPSDRLSNVCPLHFDMSVFDLFVGWRAGATVVIIPEGVTTFPVKLAEEISGNRITVWNSVPSLLSLLASYRGLQTHDLSHLRMVLFAGEVFPLKYLRRMQHLLPAAKFCNMYGQTEANSSTCYWVDGSTTSGSGVLPIGTPLPNFEVFALKDDGSRVSSPGEEGELYVRGSTVALGYWEDPVRTAAAFVADPLRPGSSERVYRTGDMVSIDADGNYHFRGRKDHMIKSRGYRIEIGEIESVLCSHQGVETAVVVPIPDETVGNRISAFIVPSVREKIGREEVFSHCARLLPKYMIPDPIVFRDVLPTTSSGKVDRKQLAESGFGVHSP